MRKYVGIDLGGTNIAAGVVMENGAIISQAEMPTRAERPWQPVLDDIARTAFMAVENAGLTVKDIEAFGIGVPGVCVNGVIPFCTNLGWHDVPINEAWKKYTDKPLFVDNDANCAGVAESISGVSASVADSVFLTLGTGLGGGIIVNNKPQNGSHGVGGELGHLTIVVDGEMCTCGKRGCFERYAAASGLIRMGVAAMAADPGGALDEATGGDPGRISPKIVADCAKSGDPGAMRAFDEYVKYLTIGINSIISFIDPSMIVLGGGVSRAGKFLLDKVRAKLPEFIFYKTLPYAAIELATLGNEAGIIGAALLGRN